MKIAVIGCGIGGLSAACFLKNNGHNVTLFEKFSEPRPVGAGLLLQPTGLRILQELGVAETIISNGSQINSIYGDSFQNKRVIFDIAYNLMSAKSHGLGIHRGIIFNALYEKTLDLNIPIITSSEITALEYENDNPRLVKAGGEKTDIFDLVIDAQGMKSVLRGKYGNVKLDKEYPYGAVWAVCTDPEKKFPTDILNQKYNSAKHMIGVLPVGFKPGDQTHSIAFFWSLRTRDYNSWRNSSLDVWKDEVRNMWPDTAHLLDQFNTHDDLTYVAYRDVVMNKWHANRLVFIGDAAHCTSPQLGQGANLALMDAYVLTNAITAEPDISKALAKYSRTRKKHTKFYQMASRMLTPFFQSDSWLFPIIRDYSFSILCKTPYVRKEMVRTLAGVKTGVFSRMKDYD